MASTDQSTVAMALFIDPEIRKNIMEQCEPATLWAIMSASSQSFRDFKQYPKTFMANSWSNLGYERIQAWRFLKAVHTQLKCTKPGVIMIRSPWQAATLDIFLKTSLQHEEEPVKELGGPLSVLARLARVQTAINTLEKAPIWSFGRELIDANDLEYFDSFPDECGWVRHTLWEIQIFCELFNHTTSLHPMQHPSFGPAIFLDRMEFNKCDRYGACNFVKIYTDLFHLLDRTYQQHMANVFEYCYVAKMDDTCQQMDSAPRLIAHGRSRLKLFVMEEMRDRLDAQMLLGLPFIAKMYHIHSNPEARDPIILRGLDKVALSDERFHRDWRPQEYEAFELSPRGNGLLGYKLTLGFRDCLYEPLRRVDFDTPIFTNGYYPPDLGGIKEAENVWSLEIRDEEMRLLHMSDAVNMSTDASCLCYRTSSTYSMEGRRLGH